MLNTAFCSMVPRTTALPSARSAQISYVGKQEQAFAVPKILRTKTVLTMATKAELKRGEDVIVQLINNNNRTDGLRIEDCVVLCCVELS